MAPLSLHHRSRVTTPGNYRRRSVSSRRRRRSHEDEVRECLADVMNCAWLYAGVPWRVAESILVFVWAVACTTVRLLRRRIVPVVKSVNRDANRVVKLESLKRVDCPICLDGFSGGDEVGEPYGCHHSFHFHCIDTWLSHSDTCPVCRSAVDRLHVSRVVDD